MQTKETKIKHRLMISDDAYRSVVNGIAALSIHTRKFESPSTLFIFALNNNITPSEMEKVHFSTANFDGDNKVHLNLPSTIKDQLDSLKANLLSLTGRQWLLRDVLVLLAFAVSQRFSGLR